MRFIEGNFNKDTGVSVVSVEHMGVVFYGIAKLHPEDQAYASTYTGCNFAEMRATIKALKYEKQYRVYHLKEWEKFLHGCLDSKKFDKESDTAKVVFRQYNRQKKQITDIDKEIKDIQNQLDELIKAKNKLIESRKKITEDISKEINLS